MTCDLIRRLLIVAATVSMGPAFASEPRHGISAFGTLQLEQGFSHFDYVNPHAPKGGTLSMVATGGQITFDSLNPLILKGVPAEGMELTFDTLMAPSGDEPDAMYGLLAESAEIADDRSWVTFTLRPEARFRDGSPVTAADVVFSYEVIKKDGHPFLRFPLRDVAKAEALDKHRVKFTFRGNETRDLPLTVAALPVLSKSYYAAAEHVFNETTTEAPMASGPYTVEEASLGRSITYRRRPDYWAKDLNINIGRFNFDRVRYDYFRDRSIAFEAFKAGTYDLREEFTSKTWATEYQFPAIEDGRVVREVLPDGNPSGVQGFFINTRRVKFADVRVRLALDYAFDYEWTNKNIFYGLYDRTVSYFENSDLGATGEPKGAELALLDKFRAVLEPDVFGPAYVPPTTDGDGNNRRNLRRAANLLESAGWRIVDGKRVNGGGTHLSIEFLTFEPTFERVIAPYVRNLQRLGIDARIRQVDPSQYERRMEGFDFDITTARYVQRNTPGVELRNYWSSVAASVSGSRNLSGIQDPIIDSLIEAVIGAEDRGALKAATAALDRVLRSGHYWVSHWYKGAHHIAYWDKFSRPSRKPRYQRGIVDTWWFDPDKGKGRPLAETTGAR